MFRAGFVFVCCVAILIAAVMVSEGLDAIFQTIGYAVVVAYAANVATRWTLSVWPKEVVKPEGKAVLITGCDTGFGLELAVRLHSAGFIVYAGCLSLESEGSERLKQISGVRLLQLDVTKNEEIEAAYKKVIDTLGDAELWCLVNNAGVAIFSEIEWCSMSVIEHMFQVNVFGVVRMTKTFLPLLRKASGRVVIVASVAGHLTYPGFVSYSMTKHALVSLSDGLRREMRKWGVSVACIEPCLYKTRLARWDCLSEALDNSWERTPDDIKEAYGFPYYQDLKGRIHKLVRKARPYVEEVVDSLEQAVTEVHPKIVYRVGGPIDKVRLWLFALLPTPLLDLLICKVVQPNRRQLSQKSTSSESSPSI